MVAPSGGGATRNETATVIAHEERRGTRRLFRHWHESCVNRRLPALDDVSAKMPPDLWERSFVVDVSDGSGAYRISRFGSALRDKFGADYTGKSVDSLPGPLVGDALDSCHAAVAAAKPFMRSDNDALFFGRSVRYRLILLPVGSSDARVEALIGTVDYALRGSAAATAGPSAAAPRSPSRAHRA